MQVDAKPFEGAGVSVLRMVLVPKRVPYSLIELMQFSRRLRMGYAVSAVSWSC
jgi:hypothetical protein